MESYCAPLIAAACCTYWIAAAYSHSRSLLSSDSSFFMVIFIFHFLSLQEKDHPIQPIQWSVRFHTLLRAVPAAQRRKLRLPPIVRHFRLSLNQFFTSEQTLWHIRIVDAPREQHRPGQAPDHQVNLPQLMGPASIRGVNSSNPDT